MNGITKSKAVGYLLVVFLLGAVAGGAGGYAWSRQREFRGPPPQGDMAKRIVADLTRELKLTAEQVKQLEPIAAEASSQMNALRSNTWVQIKEFKAVNDRRIEAFLSSEQKESFRVCRERFDKGDDRRGGSRGGGPPHEGHSRPGDSRPPGPPPN